jgi:homoserine kinase
MAFKAFAPASISNLASGFDLLGLALEKPGDHVIAKFNNDSIVRTASITGYKDSISKEENTALSAVRAMLHDLDITTGIDLEIQKGYAHSSGMGGSAASAVAAVMAVNALLKKPIKEKRGLYKYALIGERSRSPELPADNVAASLFGGIILSHPVHEPIVLPVPQGLFLTVLRPNIHITTTESRALLPAHCSLSQMTEQSYALSSLILGLYRSDWGLIERGLNDHIIEPQRKKGIPHFDDLKQKALSEGALGCSISGSGPTIFAFCNNSFVAETIHTMWSEIMENSGTEHDLFVSGINMEGARVC